MQDAENLAFDSVLYLGFRHPHRELGPWQGLSQGVPDALLPRRGGSAARELASLQGSEAAQWFPSSFHAGWDVFDVVPRALGPRSAVILDRGTYPILGWGSVRARAAGMPVRHAPHYSPEGLEALIAGLPPGTRPLICCDGFCPGCGRLAPLRAYRDLAAARGGLLLVDDTQALGILGHPEAGNPYGSGGAGSPARCGLDPRGMLIVASLAKAFGAPLAALSGERHWLRRFRWASTRVHCSPPSNAHLAAAAHALDRNRRHGETLRRDLLALVRRFRDGFRSLALPGLSLRPGAFPVQTVIAERGIDLAPLHRRLIAAGIATVLNGTAPRRLEGHPSSGAKTLSILFTSDHRPVAVDRLLGELAKALPRLSPRAGVRFPAAPSYTGA